MSAVAKMTGIVEVIYVGVGDRVEADQEVGSIEAMKMSMPVIVDKSGIVTAVKAAGDCIEAGDFIVEVE